MKKLLSILIVIIFIFPTFWRLLKPGYFSMHDDLQVMRIYEMERCFSDGQIPCRWSPDMSYGYGQPMFNFYSVFPYYLGVFIRMISPLSIMATVRTLFLIGLVGGAITMYFLARKFWGDVGGIISAVFYTFAPYHALNVYVRGALSEVYALLVLPLIFLFVYLLIEKATFKRILYLAFSFFILFTSHNISSLIYPFFVFVWSLFWIIFLKKWESIIFLAFSLILGLGLSFFFILPNLYEQRFIQRENLISDYYFYPAHFVSLSQLFFERDWGYGSSVFGPDDDISFQIGWPYWWLGIIIGFVALLKIWKKFQIKLLLLLLLLSLSGFSAFMTHQRSFFIWEAIPILRFVQFPWRFLGLTIFFLSLGIGALGYTRFLIKWPSFLVSVFLVIIFNISYFKPEYYWSWASDAEKLSGEQFELQQKAAILDYLPKTAKIAPQDKAPENPVVISGKGLTFNFLKRSNTFFFDAEIYQDAQIQIPIIYFPGWKVILGGNIIPSYPSGELGLITIDLPKGKYNIQGRFENTPVRIVGNLITGLSAVFIFCTLLILERNGKFLRFKT